MLNNTKAVVPNGIRVPERFQGEFQPPKAKREHDPAYREACIRDYVWEHKGEVMPLADLAKAAYGPTATAGAVGSTVKRLLKSGRLTRTKVSTNKKGLHYTYVWHEKRQFDPDKAARLNGPVITRSLGLPAVDFEDTTLQQLDRLVFQFEQRVGGDESADHYVAGAVKFRNWLWEQHIDQLRAREAKLAEQANE